MTDAHRTAASGLRRLRVAMTLGLALLLTACATTQPPGYDYSAFRASRPASLLVLPPINETPDVKATYSVLAQATVPLGEAGYYVLPVSLVDETFRENGMSSAHEIHQIDRSKLREIFGADAAVYMTITSYGTTYNILSSDTVATIDAKIIDLRSGQLLWKGHATASADEGESQQDKNGLAGMLVKAIVSQIVSNFSDTDHKIAGVAVGRLLNPNPTNGILPGPRAPVEPSKR